MITRIPGGVTAPRGFLASGVSSGIKQGKLDLALIFSQRMATAAGVFTRNRLAAAPVLLTKACLKAGQAQAILANSGNANCCTGTYGLEDARLMQRSLAKPLGIPPKAVLVASTGVIGRRLPLRRILKGLSPLVNRLSIQGSSSAARAILTTDSVPKSASVVTRIQGREIRIGGIAKGSGMIDPTLATMLCFLTTDAAVHSSSLRRALKKVVEKTFNRITVDGQMSTNDTVLILANGSSGLPPLSVGRPGWTTFLEALGVVAGQLARAIVQDGEGATRLIRVSVKAARSKGEALRVAKAIANAPLVKTMVAGQDPNWGRVAATVGATGVPVDPASLSIALGGIPVFQRGNPVRTNRLLLKERFRGRQVSIDVSLGRGSASVSVLGCDLTEGYVRINAKYS